MNCSMYRLTAGLLLAAVASTAAAQPYTTPTEEHELLKKDVGVWEGEVSMWEKPDAEPVMSQGVESNQMLGEMWLTSKFEGEHAGHKFTGMSALGYDPKEKKYVGGWVDTVSPFMMEMEGEYDADSKTLTMMGETTDPMTGEECDLKLVTRWEGEDKKTFEMHKAHDDDEGEWFKTLEIKYTRRK